MSRNTKEKKKKNSLQFNDRFRNKFISSKSITVFVMAAIILIALAVACVMQNQKAKAYEQQIEELSTEIKELTKDNEQLEKEKEMMGSDDYIRKIAKEKLGMVDQDEYILKKTDEQE